VPANNFIPGILNILHLEDSPADAELVKHRLEGDKLNVHITRVETEADFLHALKHLPVDVILADCKLHKYDGFAALRLAREHAPAIPFIFVTGTLDEEMGVSGIHQGATDYVLKHELARLGLAIRRALREARETIARTRAEEALRASENQYRLLFENNPTPVFVFAAGTYEFLAVNEATIRHYGYAPVQFLSMTLKDLALPEEIPLFMDRLARLKDGSGHAGIWRHRKQDGKLSEMEITCHSLKFAGKEAWLALAFNVTERLSLEAQLRQSQKMESVGQLAGGIAHDFNNLLTVISGHAGLLLAKESLPPKIADSLKEIYEAAKRAADLTRQLLTFSRKQVIQPQVVDLNEVVSNVSKMLRRILGEDIALEVNFSPSLPCVKADLGMMEQVLLNLAVNSRDAMPRGGQLRINTSSEIVDEAHTQKNAEAAKGRFVCLSFADTGCGIPPENLTRIFEPFFTTKELDRGTGLGLATVYGIIKQHRGWIEVTSEVQHGTTFKVFLPASNEPSGTVSMPAGEPRVIGGTETILVVEDEAPLLRLIHHILESHGYKVLDCANGNAALELWGEHRKKIDLLFTDMVLPDGMTGPELAEILVAGKPGLKVIYTSGYDREKLSAGPALKEGFNFIQKPFHARKLAETVHDCLHKP
jgi:two-component system, cell cycle sensor histidine kinase and response regulator CckA